MKRLLTVLFCLISVQMYAAVPNTVRTFFTTNTAATVFGSVASTYTNTTVYYVQTNGNDSTAIPGRRDKPYRTFALAVTNAGTSGNVIELGVGNWTECLFNLQNVKVRGQSRESTFLTYSNVVFALRIYGGVALENLTLRANYTNGSLTCPIQVMGGSNVIRNCSIYGITDCIFDASQGVRTDIRVENCLLDSLWDTVNLVTAAGNSTYLFQNCIADLHQNTIVAPKQFIANINGQTVYVIGCRVTINGGGLLNNIFTGYNYENVYVAGSFLQSDGQIVSMTDPRAAYPFIDGSTLIAGGGGAATSLGDRFKRQSMQRIPRLEIYSRWDNQVSVYATNTTATVGKSIAVSGAGTASANGFYVLQSDNLVPDQGLYATYSMATWTNTANGNLKLVQADTNAFNNNLYYISTNSAAATNVLYAAELEFASWTVVNGAANAPTVSNYAPDLTLTIDGLVVNNMGFTSTRSNALAPASFTFPATTVTWTNPVNCSILVYIDNTGVTATSIRKNGTQIGVNDTAITIGLKPNEYFSQTYSIGTPVGKWEPFP